MFKFVAIGDTHIHIRKGIPEEWQISRYKTFFNQVIDKCLTEGACLLIAGDTLHSVEPSPKELGLFLDFLHDLEDRSIDTYLVSGNHETKGVLSSVLDDIVVHRFKNVHYRPDFNIAKDGVVLHLLNHDQLNHHTKNIEEGKFNLLLSHFRCTLNKFVQEEVDVAALTEGYDIVIAGDIHLPFFIGNTHYTNCPVNEKFETNPECGFLYGEIDLALSPEPYLIRVKSNAPRLRLYKTSCEDFHKLKYNDYDFFKVEVTGTPAELRELKKPQPNVLIEKIPTIDSVLVASDDTPTLKEIELVSGTIEEELTHYLKELGYAEAKVAQLVNIMKEI